MLKTVFWRSAATSLPKPLQVRYARDFEDAERFDLALEAVFDAVKSVRRLFSGHEVHRA